MGTQFDDEAEPANDEEQAAESEWNTEGDVDENIEPELHPEGEAAVSEQKKTAEATRKFFASLAAYTPHAFITPTIIVANVVVFILMAATGINPLAPTIQGVLDWGANFGPKTMDGEWWRLFTCMFLHFGIIHIGFNMWVLFDVGRLVERLVGNLGFALIYVASGLMGSLASLAWNPTVVSAGASGAVFGAVGALLGFIVIRHDTVPVEILKSLRGSFGAFLVYNLVFGMVVPGIDMAAHVGGLAMGFVGGLICSQPLTPAVKIGRWWRNGVVLVAGIASVLAAVYALPEAPPDVGDELAEFGRLELVAINELDNLLSDGLPDDKLADGVEQRVLPIWGECRRCIDVAMDAPLADQEYLSNVAEYIDVRSLSCQVLVNGLREQDEGKIDEFNRLYTSADALANKLNPDQQ